MPSPLQPIPKWLDARATITESLHTAERQIIIGEKRYYGGYYDACRHALKALPPHVKYPDDEDWRESGFAPPEEGKP